MPWSERHRDRFHEDDYFELYDRYFKPILKKGGRYFSPSAYLGTRPESQRWITPACPPTESEVVDYINDTGRNMLHRKAQILDLFSYWDNTPYTLSNLTLCHSVTVGSLAILHILKERGINTVIFETPAYYATLYQADALGLSYITIPTYFAEGFHLNITDADLPQDENIALWLTQPRISLGHNQNPEQLMKLRVKLRKGDFVIVDEATEQYVPSHLASFDVRLTDGPTLIKIRSMFKGMGINGIRLAVVLHPDSLKAVLDRALWLYQGGLDVNSVIFASEYASRSSKFRRMLEASNTQVVELRRHLDRIVLGSPVSMSRLENGYVGTAIVTFPRKENSNRERLLQYLRRKRIIANLGSSMRFAFDPKHEFVRLNYFLPREEIVSTLLVLAEFPG